jgi:phosphatidate phosphatase PAH1
MEDERCGRKSKGAAALDVIVVLPTGVSDGNDLLFNEEGAVASSDFFVQFPDRTGSSSFFRDLQFHTASVCTVDVNFGKEEAQAVKDDHKLTQDDSSLASNHISVFINNQCIPELSMERKSGGNCTFAKGSLRPQPNILKSLVKRKILTPGEHVLRYVSNGTNSVKYVDARLFVWYSTDKLIVSDIDGTVTKSDISGVLDTVIRESYSHVRKLRCYLFCFQLSHYFNK